ncbi:hypothetical protein PVAND_017455 [Polypedilum vanderplanki]|uniref:Huntingtin-like protein n=1 Tax=Polypedilum vanderplanki TaxID=319348 RepID=A0A9J6BIQ1_POLVA|nr:hypothetical protein PVAND_017455 [Polypedilum vanderplanki]
MDKLAFQKAIDTLKSTDCNSKEKIQKFDQIYSTLSLLTNHSNYKNYLQKAVQILILFCEDNDSNVRISAEENLNRIIRNCERQHQLILIQIELYHEIKKNGNERSLRICLNLFSHYCHLIKHRRKKIYAQNLIPCLLSIAKRREPLVIETFAEFMKTFSRNLLNCLNDYEVMKLIDLLIDNLSQECAIKKRCSAQIIITILEHSTRNKSIMRSIIVRIQENLSKSQEVNTILGTLGLLRLIIPHLMMSQEFHQKIIEMLENCLNYLKNDSHNHTIINANLEFINSLLNASNENHKMSKLICDNEAHKEILLSRHSALLNNSRKSSIETIKNQDLLQVPTSNKSSISPGSGDFSDVEGDSFKSTDFSSSSPGALKNVIGAAETMSIKSTDSINSFFTSILGNSSTDSVTKFFRKSSTDSPAHQSKLSESADEKSIDLSLGHLKDENVEYRDSQMLPETAEMALDDNLEMDETLEIVEASNNEQKIYIGSIYDQSIVEYIVRLVSSKFLLDGKPKILINDQIVRVSIKNLALLTIAACVELKSEILLLKLSKDYTDESMMVESLLSYLVDEDIRLEEEEEKKKKIDEIQSTSDFIEIKENHFGECTTATFLDYFSPLNKTIDEQGLISLKNRIYEEKTKDREENAKKINRDLCQLLARSDIIESKKFNLPLMETTLKMPDDKDCQFVADILLYASHGDPVLRGNVYLIIGNFVRKVLKKNFDYQKFIERNEFVKDLLKFDKMIELLLTGIKDEIHSVAKQTLTVWELIFNNVISVLNTNEIENVLNQILRVIYNKYWLVQCKYCDVISKIDIGMLRMLIGDGKSLVYEKQIRQQLFTLIKDNDFRVRNHASESLANWIKNLSQSNNEMTKLDQKNNSLVKFVEKNFYRYDSFSYGINRNKNFSNEIEHHLSKILYELSNFLMELKDKNQQFGVIYAIKILIRNFNPLTYSTVWKEFNFINIFKSFINKNPNIAFDISCQCDMLEVLAALIEADGIQNGTFKDNNEFLTHLLKICNIYAHLVNNTKLLIVPKGKTDIFTSAKELALINSLGFFTNDHFYLKFYLVIKSSYDSYRMTINFDAEFKLKQLLHLALKNIQILLEFQTMTDDGKLIEEIVSYLNQLVLFQPDDCILTTKILLKFLFQKNFCNRKIELDGILNAAQNNDSKFIFEKYETFFSFDTTTIAQNSEKLIKLFDTLVIQGLRLFSKSSTGLQAKVLDLLCQLLEFNINYMQLDAKKVFVDFVLKQLEYIENGLVIDGEILARKIIEFLIYLTKLKDKKILTMPKIINIIDNLLASTNQSAKSCGIQALLVMTNELFFKNIKILSTNEPEVIEAHLKDLNAQREVALSMMIKFVHHKDIQEYFEWIFMKSKIENNFGIEIDENEIYQHLLQSSSSEFKLALSISKNILLESKNFKSVIVIYWKLLSSTDDAASLKSNTSSERLLLSTATNAFSLAASNVLGEQNLNLPQASDQSSPNLTEQQAASSPKSSSERQNLNPLEQQSSSSNRQQLSSRNSLELLVFLQENILLIAEEIYLVNHIKLYHQKQNIQGDAVKIFLNLHLKFLKRELSSTSENFIFMEDNFNFSIGSQNFTSGNSIVFSGNLNSSSTIANFLTSNSNKSSLTENSINSSTDNSNTFNIEKFTNFLQFQKFPTLFLDLKEILDPKDLIESTCESKIDICMNFLISLNYKVIEIENFINLTESTINRGKLKKSLYQNIFNKRKNVTDWDGSEIMNFFKDSEKMEILLNFSHDSLLSKLLEDEKISKTIIKKLSIVKISTKKVKLILEKVHKSCLKDACIFLISQVDHKDFNIFQFVIVKRFKNQRENFDFEEIKLKILEFKLENKFKMLLQVMQTSNHKELPNIDYSKMKKTIDEQWLFDQAQNVINKQQNPLRIAEMLYEIKSESKLTTLLNDENFNIELLIPIINVSFENMLRNFRIDCIQKNPHLTYMKISPLLKVAIVLLTSLLEKNYKRDGNFGSSDEYCESSEKNKGISDKSDGNMDGNNAKNEKRYDSKNKIDDENNQRDDKAGKNDEKSSHEKHDKSDKNNKTETQKFHQKSDQNDEEILKLAKVVKVYMQNIHETTQIALIYVEVKFIEKYLLDNLLKEYFKELLMNFVNLLIERLDEIELINACKDYSSKYDRVEASSSDKIQSLETDSNKFKALKSVQTNYKLNSIDFQNIEHTEIILTTIKSIISNDQINIDTINDQIISFIFQQLHEAFKNSDFVTKYQHPQLFDELDNEIMKQIIFIAKIQEIYEDGEFELILPKLTEAKRNLIEISFEMTKFIFKINKFYQFTITPYEVILNYRSGDDLLDKIGLKLKQIPIEYLNDSDLLERYVRRINRYGFTQRQEFEEIFMTLLVLLNQWNEIQEAEEQFCIKQLCLQVNIDLILSCFSQNKNFAHLPRLEKFTKIDKIGIKKLHHIQDLLSSKLNIFYQPNLERVSINDENCLTITKSFGMNQFSLDYTWNMTNNEYNKKNMTYIYAEKLGIDYKSSIQLIYDLMTQMIDENPVIVLPNLSKLVDLLDNNEQFKWINKKMLALYETVCSEDTISHQYIIYLLCRSSAVLVPSLSEIQQLIPIINKYLGCNHMFVRNATLHGLLCLFESLIKTNTTIGGISDEIKLLRTTIVNYTNKNGIVYECASTSTSPEHDKLVWSLNFYVIENTLKFGDCNELLIDTIISANNILKRSNDIDLYFLIINGLERLIIVNEENKLYREKVEKLALDLLKNENKNFSIGGLKLLVTCMYVGSLQQLENTEKSNGIVQDEPEIVMQSTEKIEILFNRIRNTTADEAEVYGRVLGRILKDLLPPNEILTKIIKELLILNQSNTTIISKIIHQVFRTAIDSSFLVLLQEWLICSLPNFLNYPNRKKSILFLNLIFMSSTLNQNLLKLFPLSLDEEIPESDLYQIFIISAKDFYDRLSDKQKSAFRDAFSNRLMTSSTSPTRNLNENFFQCLIKNLQ